MSKQETLKIFERDTTITSSRLRKIGYIPATVYGKSVEPFSIQVKAHDFELALARGIRRFRLEGMEQFFDADVKQLQKNNTQQTVMHIEFHVNASSSGKTNKPETGAKSFQSKSESSETASLYPDEEKASFAEEAVPAAH